MWTFRLCLWIPAAIFCIIAIGCTGGWAGNKEHNQSLRRGTMTVTSHPPIIYETCTSQRCTGSGDNEHCTTITYTCYTATIGVNVFTDQNVQILTNVILQVATRVGYYSTALDAQNSYPIGLNRTAYYQVNNQGIPTGSVQFDPNPEESVFIAGMVFWGLTLFCLVVWLFGELAMCLSDCSCSCNTCNWPSWRRPNCCRRRSKRSVSSVSSVYSTNNTNNSVYSTNNFDSTVNFDSAPAENPVTQGGNPVTQGNPVTYQQPVFTNPPVFDLDGMTSESAEYNEPPHDNVNNTIMYHPSAPPLDSSAK